MLKTETREIGGKRYAVTQLASDKGIRIFFELFKLLGPGMIVMLKSWNGKKVDARAAMGGVSELLQALDYDKFSMFVAAFMESTALIGDQGQRVELVKMRSLAFAGDYASLIKWIGFCLEVNFGSFFDDMGLTSLPSPADEQSASTSPEMSAG